MLEYCIREDLKMKKSRMMAVLDPVKVVIDNYPEGQTEYLDVVNNLENEALGSRKIPFSRELYIEREDFMEEPPKKYFRMFPGNEVRLMNAYFVTCNSFEKDADGNVTVIHCTYDPASRGGNSPDGRKVKGTIHWVSATHAVPATVRLYENIVDEEKGVYNEDGSLNLNPNSLTVLKNCMVEENLAGAKGLRQFPVCTPGILLCGCKGFDAGAAGVQPHCVTEEFIQAANCRTRRDLGGIDMNLLSGLEKFGLKAEDTTNLLRKKRKKSWERTA